MRNQRLRVYDRWDENVLVLECGTNPTHLFPYLEYQSEGAEQEADFLKGSASIANVSWVVLDKRTVAADQSTGWLTALLPDMVGGVLTWEEHDGAVWKLMFRGICDAPVLNDDLVSYTVHAKDIREKERKTRGWERVTSTLLFPAGVIGGYGKLGDNQWLVPPPPPVRGTYDLTAGRVLLTEFNKNLVPIHMVRPPGLAEIWKENIIESDLQTRLGGVLASVRFVRVEWRPWGSSGDWFDVQDVEDDGRTLIEPPGTSNGFTDVRHSYAIIEGVRTKINAVLWIALSSPSGTQVVPANGQDVEVRVRYTGPPTKRTPQHLEGTFGSMLRQTHDIHGLSYSEVRMAALEQNTPWGRTRILEPVEDLREWIERELMRLMGLAPTLDDEWLLSPVTQNVPPIGETLLNISDGDIVDGEADWIQSTKRANIAVFRLINEIYDPLDLEADGDGIVEMERMIEFVNPAATIPTLEETVQFDGRTLRGAWGYFTEYAISIPSSIMGHRRDSVFLRYPTGAHLFRAVARDELGKQALVGKWAHITLTWLPDWADRRRGTNRIGQVVRRHRLDDVSWELWLEDGGFATTPSPLPVFGALTITAENIATANVTGVPAGGHARVEYAVAAVAPSASSGDWDYLGRLEAPGALETSVLPGGLNLCVRMRGEIEGQRPSGWVGPISVATNLIPTINLLKVVWWAHKLDIAIESELAAGARIRWAVHPLDEIPTAWQTFDMAVPGAVSVVVPATEGALTVEAIPYSTFGVGGVSGVAGRMVPRTVEYAGDIALRGVEVSLVLRVQDNRLYITVTPEDERTRLIQVWVKKGSTPLLPDGNPDPLYLVWDEEAENRSFDFSVVAGEEWHVVARGIDEDGWPGPLTDDAIIIAGDTGPGYPIDLYGVVSSVSLSVGAGTHTIDWDYAYPVDIGNPDETVRVALSVDGGPFVLKAEVAPWEGPVQVLFNPCVTGNCIQRHFIYRVRHLHYYGSEPVQLSQATKGTYVQTPGATTPPGSGGEEEVPLEE